ncbi:MAG: hypothetical protein IT337_15750 [Thermomicrobiales bacterium]|nr:hypothetical protein [Thermomicrobiales bacterium]
MKDPPANRLDPRAKTLWRAEAALSAIPLLALAALAVWLLRRVAIAPDWLAPAPLLAALLWAGWDITETPLQRIFGVVGVRMPPACNRARFCTRCNASSAWSGCGSARRWRWPPSPCASSTNCCPSRSDGGWWT